MGDSHSVGTPWRLEKSLGDEGDVSLLLARRIAAVSPRHAWNQLQAFRNQILRKKKSQFLSSLEKQELQAVFPSGNNLQGLS